jgi:hypothetical protein
MALRTNAGKVQNNQNGAVSNQLTKLEGGRECSVEAVNLWMCDRVGELSSLYKPQSTCDLYIQPVTL